MSDVFEHRNLLLLSTEKKKKTTKKLISKTEHHNSNYRYLSLTDANIFKYMGRTTCFQD